MTNTAKQPRKPKKPSGAAKGKSAGKRQPNQQNRDLDWERIEEQFRAGQISIRAIATEHGITDGAIRKRARVHGWKRDLTEKVRNAVRAELVRSGAQDQRTENDIIKEHAATGAQVVREHRKDVSRLRRIGEVLAVRLEALLDGAEVNGLCIGDKESAGDLLEKLSRVSTRVVQLERQAFSVDDPKSEQPARVEIVWADQQ
jgi:hypothetical protein